MPIYEYKCAQCGEIEEAFQKFSDKPKTTCMKCSGALQKLISQSTFHLKGTGWYVTDYVNKDKGAAGTTENKSDKEEKAASGDKETKASSGETGESSKTSNKKSTPTSDTIS